MKKTITQQNSELNRITFRQGMETYTQPNRLQERPEYKWADRVIIDIWEEIQQKHPQHRYVPLNLNDNNITQIIIQHAYDTINEDNRQR